MAIDQRLFEYPLEVHLVRLRWRLDAAMTAFANTLSERTRLQADCAALAAESAAAATRATPAAHAAIDLGRARHALAFLASMRGRQAALSAQLEGCEERVAMQRGALDALRLEIEQVERDRDACLREHALEQAGRQAREADHDWTTRKQWRAAAAAAEGGRS